MIQTSHDVLTLISCGLALAGLVLIYLENRIAASLQHQFVFLATGLLALSLIPRAPLSPTVQFVSGIILFSLHISTYYSGTSQNSGRLYGLILIMAAIVPALHLFPQLYNLPLGRLMLGVAIWVIMGLVEKQLSAGKIEQVMIEKVLLGLWLITAVVGSFHADLQLLPDIIFMMLLVVHLERAWGDLHIPAPMVVFYALLLSWNLQFIFEGGEQIFTLGTLSPTGLLLLTGLGVGLVFWRIGFTKSLSKRWMYFYLLQEIVLNYSALTNPHLSTPKAFDLARFLVFAALIGLFVMIESRASRPLERSLIAGIGHQRLRLTLFTFGLILLLTLFPLAYLTVAHTSSAPLLILIVGGGLLLVDQVIMSFSGRPEAGRIIRPSLSIWSTVILTIAWTSTLLISTLQKL